MRRKDTEVCDRAEILAILDGCKVLRLGLCRGNMPYVVPLHFGWEDTGDELHIYMHGASAGKKLDILRENPNACFEADGGFRNIEDEAACNWTAAFASVMGEGVVTILTDDAEKAHGLDVLMRHQGFAGQPEYSPAMLRAVTVFRMCVHTLTGKRKG